MNETFGQRLARLRKEKGFTQEDIADKINISPQAVSKWENDISSPDIQTLIKLSDIFEVSLDDLLGKEKKC
ncbi:MAG: helix-turn-helix transcriptional regulator [Bacillales bacterium]|nr:helix-turn-helix transcriptional regulator [Bacillales bacterium]